MKKTLTLAFLSAGFFSANAQVTLTAAQVPAPGTTYLKYDANVPSPPFTFSKSGSNNTWDFTGITTYPGQDDTVYYVAAKDLPGGSFFPTATGGSYEKGDDTYPFYKVESTGAWLQGFSGDFLGNGSTKVIPLSQPVNALPFPYTASSKFGGSVTIQFKASGAEVGYPVDSVWIFITQITHKGVIATGNIVLPSGTYPALLERSIETQVDSSLIKVSGKWNLAPNFPKKSTDSTFKWYTQESIEEYAHVIYEKGQISDVSFFKSVVLPTSLFSADVFAQKLNCFPNPTKEKLQFETASGEIKHLSIYSANGEEVITLSSPSSSISVAHLMPGLYTAKLVLADGKVRTSRFVKE